MQNTLTRRQAREVAIQLLYQIDINQYGVEKNLNILREERPDLELREGFLVDIIKGTCDKLDEIDKIVNDNTRDWKISRMAKVDRNIIRLAMYEILYQPDIPLRVSIDEAIELAKSFSNDQSAKFVNGILGRLADKLALNNKEE